MESDRSTPYCSHCPHRHHCTAHICQCACGTRRMQEPIRPTSHRPIRTVNLALCGKEGTISRMSAILGGGGKAWRRVVSSTDLRYWSRWEGIGWNFVSFFDEPRPNSRAILDCRWGDSASGDPTLISQSSRYAKIGVPELRKWVIATTITLVKT